MIKPEYIYMAVTGALLLASCVLPLTGCITAGLWCLAGTFVVAFLPLVALALMLLIGKIRGGGRPADPRRPDRSYAVAK